MARNDHGIQHDLSEHMTIRLVSFLHISSRKNGNMSHNPMESTTESGLVVKNTDRLENIKTRMESRVEVTLSSWQICRIMRRDFQIMSAKMYKTCCNKDDRLKMRDLLLELMLQAEEMRSLLEEFEEADDAEPTIMSVRIVSHETAMLFQALKQADPLYTKLNRAFSKSQITSRRQAELMCGFERAFADVKLVLFSSHTKPSNKTAGELGKEMGIS